MEIIITCVLLRLIKSGRLLFYIRIHSAYTFENLNIPSYFKGFFFYCKGRIYDLQKQITRSEIYNFYVKSPSL